MKGKVRLIFRSDEPGMQIVDYFDDEMVK